MGFDLRWLGPYGFSGLVVNSIGERESSMGQRSYSSADKTELDELRVAYFEARKRVDDLLDKLSKAVVRMGEREEELYQTWLREVSEESLTETGRAPAFKFFMAKVPQGATLVWVHDPKITCTVHNERSVLYKGKSYSLSGLAKQLRGTQSERGPDHWLYEGETLQTRRERFEC